MAHPLAAHAPSPAHAQAILADHLSVVRCLGGSQIATAIGLPAKQRPVARDRAAQRREREAGRGYEKVCAAIGGTIPVPAALNVEVEGEEGAAGLIARALADPRHHRLLWVCAAAHGHGCDGETKLYAQRVLATISGISDGGRPRGLAARLAKKRFREHADVTQYVVGRLLLGYTGSLRSAILTELNNYSSAFGSRTPDGSPPLSMPGESHIPAQVDAATYQIALGATVASKSEGHELTLGDVFGPSATGRLAVVPAIQVLSSLDFKSAPNTAVRLAALVPALDSSEASATAEAVPQVRLAQSLDSWARAHPALSAALEALPEPARERARSRKVGDLITEVATGVHGLGPGLAAELESSLAREGSSYAIRRSIRGFRIADLVSCHPELAADLCALPNWDSLSVELTLREVLTAAVYGGQERVAASGLPESCAVRLCEVIAHDIEALPRRIGAVRMPQSLALVRDRLRTPVHSHDEITLDPLVQAEGRLHPIDDDPESEQESTADSPTRHEDDRATDDDASDPGCRDDHGFGERVPDRLPAELIHFDDPLPSVHGLVRAWVFVADNLRSAKGVSGAKPFVDLLLGRPDRSAFGFAEGLLRGEALDPLVHLAVSSGLEEWQRTIDDVARAGASTNRPAAERESEILERLAMSSDVVHGDAGTVAEVSVLARLDLDEVDQSVIIELHRLSGRCPTDLVSEVLGVLRYANAYKRLRLVAGLDRGYEPPTAA